MWNFDFGLRLFLDAGAWLFIMMIKFQMMDNHLAWIDQVRL